jgi:hypothetical protein
MREQRIPIERINMPEHRTSQMRDIIHLEQPVPAAHPCIAICIKNQHFILRFCSVLGRRDFTAADVLQGHFVAVLGYPVEATVFFVGEECGGGVFVETG